MTGRDSLAQAHGVAAFGDSRVSELVEGYMLSRFLRVCQHNRTNPPLLSFSSSRRIAARPTRLYTITNAPLRNMASVAPEPVSSTAQPASNPAIQNAGGAKKSKAKKGEQSGSAFPLEVCVLELEA